MCTVKVFYRFCYVSIKSPLARIVSIFLFALAISQRQYALCYCIGQFRDYDCIPRYACAPRDPEAF